MGENFRVFLLFLSILFVYEPQCRRDSLYFKISQRFASELSSLSNQSYRYWNIFSLQRKKGDFLFSFLPEWAEGTQHTKRQWARISSVPGLLVAESKWQIFLITDTLIGNNKQVFPVSTAGSVCRAGRCFDSEDYKLLWCPRIPFVDQDHTSKILPSWQRYDNIFAGAESQPLFPRAAPYCIFRKHLPNMLLLHQRQRLQPFPGISSFSGTAVPVEPQGAAWMRSQCSWDIASSLAQYHSPWSITNLLHFLKLIYFYWVLPELRASLLIVHSSLCWAKEWICLCLPISSERSSG